MGDVRVTLFQRDETLFHYETLFHIAYAAWLARPLARLAPDAVRGGGKKAA